MGADETKIQRGQLMKGKGYSLRRWDRWQRHHSSSPSPVSWSVGMSVLFWFVVVLNVCVVPGELIPEDHVKMLFGLLAQTNHVLDTATKQKNAIVAQLEAIAGARVDGNGDGRVSRLEAKAFCDKFSGGPGVAAAGGAQGGEVPGHQPGGGVPIAVEDYTGSSSFIQKGYSFADCANYVRSSYNSCSCWPSPSASATDAKEQSSNELEVSSPESEPEVFRPPQKRIDVERLQAARGINRRQPPRVAPIQPLADGPASRPWLVPPHAATWRRQLDSKDRTLIAQRKQDRQWGSFHSSASFIQTTNGDHLDKHEHTDVASQDEELD
ncbi:unnamed protein product [Amoebophrya sp. A120]|nr:unnamed protein product [Amoebophrya sp. A120]|eukprot:GSA120T00025034001.1